MTPSSPADDPAEKVFHYTYVGSYCLGVVSALSEKTNVAFIIESEYLPVSGINITSAGKEVKQIP